MTMTLRVGLVGCGRVVERFYLPAFARLASAGEAIRLEAVADPRPDRRERAARSGVAVFASATELLGSGTVDAVVVATPAETHAEVACLALRAGLPVLVEKPLATSVAEGETLRDAVRSTGTVLMAGFNRRHWAPVRVLASALREADGQASGTPFSARLLFATDKDAWDAVTKLGDALEDLVSHQLDLLRHLFRHDIESVRAAPGSPDRASVLVRLEGGIEAECRASQRATYGEAIDVRRGATRWLVRSGSDRIHPARGPAREALDLADRVRRRLGRRTPALAGSFDTQLLAFAEFIRRGTAPEPGVEDGLAVLRAVEAARRSAARGGEEARP